MFVFLFECLFGKRPSPHTTFEPHVLSSTLRQDKGDASSVMRHIDTFFAAVYADDFVTITEMVSKRHFLTSVDKDMGMNVLAEAVYRGDKKAVNILLEAKADINGRSMYNTTALMKAVEAHSVEFVEFLLSAGAEVDLKNDNADETAFIMATKRGVLDIMRVLLAAGADVNARSAFGWTSLMVAVQAHDASTAAFLLANKADINAVCDSGRSALHYAATGCRVACIQLLVDAKARVDITDDNGQTALMAAAHLQYWISDTKCISRASFISENEQIETMTILFAATEAQIRAEATRKRKRKTCVE